MTKLSDRVEAAAGADKEMDVAIEWIGRNSHLIKNTVALAHRSNLAPLTSWMREDERDWRDELSKHLAALRARGL